MIIRIICSLCIDRKAQFSPDSHFVVGVRRKTNRLRCCQSKMMKWTIAYLRRITSAWDLINCKYLQRSVDLRFRSSSSETIVRQAVSWNSWLRHSESSQHLAAGRRNMETWKKCHTKCSQLWSGHESNAGFTVPQLLCRSCLRVFSPAQPQGTCGSDYVLACGGESPSTLDCRHRLWVFGIRWVYHGLPLLHAFTIYPY